MNSPPASAGLELACLQLPHGAVRGKVGADSDWRAPPSCGRDRLPGETKLQAVEKIHQHGLNGAKCRDRAHFRPKSSSDSLKTPLRFPVWKGRWRGQNAFFSVL